MNLCEVIKFDDQWRVYAVNPNNPDDRRLVNVCETEEYANGLADDVNRLAKVAAECGKTENAKKESSGQASVSSLPSGDFETRLSRVVRLED